MKVLVIGGGGREHALVWKLRQSPRVSQIYCLPGNGGICEEAACLPGDPKSLSSLLAAAHQIQPDLTVVGPEIALSLGVVDEFTRRGLKIFGPTQRAAQLETSKSFAKEFMQRHQVPTAHYAVCTTEDELRKSLGLFSTPVVVKADGLAAGKGVVIAPTKEEAATAGVGMFNGKLLGTPVSHVVLEEFLEGEEVSFLAGPQADWRRRSRRQHRRNGSLLHGCFARRRHDRLAAESHCAAGNRRHEVRGRRVPRHFVLRADDDRAWAHGAGVQLPLWRSRNPGRADAAG
jgi:phosphoribosylamine--glycine ligase